MSTPDPSPQRRLRGTGNPVSDVPAPRTTTLYDLVAALQTLLPPDADDLVVALLGYWRRTGRITARRELRPSPRGPGPAPRRPRS